MKLNLNGPHCRSVGLILLLLMSSVVPIKGEPAPSAVAAKLTAIPALPPPASSFTPSTDALYQWSVPVGKDPERRAYLWIPEKCQRVRGVILGVQNMLEQLIFEDPAVRQAATDAGLAIVWITPADDADTKDSPFHRFNPGKDVVAEIEQILTNLATESGYAEIQGAPLLITAHSAATPFVYGMAAALGSERVVAIFPCRGWTMGVPRGIPALQITSEYAEVGGEKWGEVWRKDRDSVQRARTQAGDDCLFGSMGGIGAGHFEWNPEEGPLVAMFIRKAVQARLPASSPTNGPVTLKSISPKSGWLIDPAKLGTPAGRPVAYADWKGDTKNALWYIDRELAQAINDYMVTRLAKKPQAIDFLDDKGLPCALEKGGGPSIPAKIMEDGATFKVTAAFLDQAPSQIYGGIPLGHAPGSILFKAGSGAIRQTGPDTFRIWMKRGSVLRQSSPWEPWIIAYQPGDAAYRRADRPGHPWLYAHNKDGKPQSIAFDKIADRRYGPGVLKLVATSDAGLPVQFYVISGPVELKEDDNATLRLLPLPPRAKFPVKVILGAYQWGRVTNPKVQTAGPVFQEFLITK
ncbi:MAG: hypothetical protein JF599_01715 [Verrucomicrobia bacterium]|nr:hypothetical protein [Verrucomicrobiota bacterium]